jgi:hypothetical protein
MPSRTSSTSILLFSIVLVTIIVIPAIAADAGFVCVLKQELKQIVLFLIPLECDGRHEWWSLNQHIRLVLLELGCKCSTSKTSNNI